MKKYLFMMIAATVMAYPVHATACDGKGAKSAACPTGHSSGHGKHGHHAIPGNSLDHIRKILKSADAIGLDNSQRKQVATLLIDAETQVAKAHAEAEVTVAEFRAKMHTGKLSDKEVKAYTKKMGELRAEKLSANLMASVKASRLLSDEQKSKLYSKRKDWDGAK